jgi:EpsI family protein
VSLPAPVRTLIVATALLGALALTHSVTSVAAAAPPRLSDIPVTLDGWIGSPAPPLDPDVARVLAADDYLHRYYRSDAGSIEMDVAYYSQPRVGANMHSPLNCLPGNGWQIDNVRNVDVTTAAGAWPVRDTIVSRRGVRYALTYWFQSRERILGDELATRFYLLTDALRRKPTDAGLVRLMMQMGGDGTRERATLAGFATGVIPEISARLR